MFQSHSNIHAERVTSSGGLQAYQMSQARDLRKRNRNSRKGICVCPCHGIKEPWCWACQENHFDYAGMMCGD
jgi:hypothetical protein